MRARIVVGVVLIVACGCGKQAPTNQAPKDQTAGEGARPSVSLSLTSTAAAAEDQAWGTVKGQIVFAADPPAAAKINVTKDQAHCLAKGALLSEAWVINPKNKGVRWTVIWLAPEPDSKTPLPIHPKLKDVPAKAAEIDQPCCAFVPHVLGMREGQQLIVKNSAPVPHNINVTGNPKKNAGFNYLMPAGGEIKAPALKADRYPLQMSCNIHPWMNGRIAVFDHPYFAITDEDGNFEIKDAPAGEYRLKVWHESVGWRGGAAGNVGQKITIKPSGATELGKLELKEKYDD
ncbi:hypothetical protein AYO40_06780 [Planctomycetaceae bacterium SCGC AG-212-D15]|nr:hypothetical protein AYO40_06780 [Planctomycetaceae bacterium SCGC AG-212-D15]